LCCKGLQAMKNAHAMAILRPNGNKSERASTRTIVDHLLGI
jgi:hypothetical protein